LEFNIKSRERRSAASYSEAEKKTATKFAKAVDKELKEFLKAAVLFGSAAKEKRKHNLTESRQK
jgi:hypothetical protein